MRHNAQTAPILPTPGQRVHTANYGLQHRDGITLTQVTDQWGTRAVVLMDDGTTETCNGLNRGPGIGWHAGISPTKRWTQEARKEGH